MNTGQIMYGPVLHTLRDVLHEPVFMFPTPGSQEKNKKKFQKILVGIKKVLFLYNKTKLYTLCQQQH
jgi:hypothetical protein